jgi:hypothetical protein
MAKNGAGSGAKKRIGRKNHDLAVVPRRTTPVFPGIEYLSCMAIAVGHAFCPVLIRADKEGERGECLWRAGGDCSVSLDKVWARMKLRIRTNGAAGVIPATLKYVTEFISQDPEREYVFLAHLMFGSLRLTCSIMTFLLTASGRSYRMTGC